MLKGLVFFTGELYKKCNYIHILIVKDSLTNEGITSFDKIFQQSTTTHYQNARSDSSFKLRKQKYE